MKDSGQQPERPIPWRLRQQWEQGSATPAIVGIMAAATFLWAAIAFFMAVQTVQVRVQAAADLAALSGGQAPSALMMVPPIAAIPCGFAQQVATENGVTLAECFVDQGDVWVVASREVTAWGIPLSVVARARAGPVPGTIYSGAEGGT